MQEILVISAVLAAALVGFTIAGVAGFGGGILTLPVLVWAFGVREAVPALAIAQLMGSFGRIALYRESISWKVVLWFSLGAVPMSVLGGLLFIEAPTNVVVRILGASMLATVVYGRTSQGRRSSLPVWVFAPLGAVFGFLVAFLGVPGPFMATFYLSHGLTAGAYLATSSLGMLVAQVPKIGVYGSSGLYTQRAVLTGVAMGVIAILSAYAGRWFLGRISPSVFRKLIDVMLIASGVLFIVRG